METAARERWQPLIHDCSNRTKFARDLNLRAHEGGWFGASSYGCEFPRIPYAAFLPTLARPVQSCLTRRNRCRRDTAPAISCCDEKVFWRWHWRFCCSLWLRRQRRGKSARFEPVKLTHAAVLSDVTMHQPIFTWKDRDDHRRGIRAAARHAFPWSLVILSRIDEPEPDEIMSAGGRTGVLPRRRAGARCASPAAGGVWH